MERRKKCVRTLDLKFQKRKKERKVGRKKRAREWRPWERAILKNLASETDKEVANKRNQEKNTRKTVKKRK